MEDSGFQWRTLLGTSFQLSLFDAQEATRFATQFIHWFVRSNLSDNIQGITEPACPSVVLLAGVE